MKLLHPTLRPLHVITQEHMTAGRYEPPAEILFNLVEI